MPYFREKYGNIGKRMPYLFTRYTNKKEKHANL